MDTPKKAGLNLVLNKGDGPRPYWHVDAKWVSGIVLAIVLAVWLILFAAWQITSRDIAVPLMTNMITFGMKQGDTAANQQALEELRKKIAESPTKSIEPLPGLPATITEADLLLGADGLREKLFRQITEPLYDKGARKLAEERTADKSQQDKFVNDATALSFINRESHDRIGWWVIIWGAVTLVIVGLTVLFSYRFGRLVTPAVVLLLVSLPGLAAFLVLSAIVAQPSAPAANAQSYFELAAAAKGAFAPAVSAGRQVYLTAVLVGLGLLVVSLLGKVIFATTKKAG